MLIWAACTGQHPDTKLSPEGSDACVPLAPYSVLQLEQPQIESLTMEGADALQEGCSRMLGRTTVCAGKAGGLCGEEAPRYFGLRSFSLSPEQMYPQKAPLHPSQAPEDSAMCAACRECLVQQRHDALALACLGMRGDGAVLL